MYLKQRLNYTNKTMAGGNGVTATQTKVFIFVRYYLLSAIDSDIQGQLTIDINMTLVTGNSLVKVEDWSLSDARILF